MKILSLAKIFAPSLLVLSLAACGGSDSGSDNDPIQTPPPPPVSGGDGGEDDDDDDDDNGQDDDNDYDSGSGDDSGGDDSDDDDSGDDGNGDDDVSFEPISGLNFNLAGSTALQALSSAVSQDPTAAVMSADGTRTLAGFAKADTHTIRRMDDSDEDDLITNLLAVDENGNTVLAIDSEWPALVEYSVMHPGGEYVYIALNPDNYNSNIDYGQVVWQTDCGIYKVSTTDNSYECLAEGLLVQGVNDDNLRSISNNSKPMIFDGTGSVYFIGGGYRRECYDDGYCWGNRNWNESIIYRISEDGELRALTNDLQGIRNFQVLGDGRVVYFGWNEASRRNELNIFNDPGTALLSESWGVEFYTVDQDQTVVFADDNSSTIRFAKPRAEGGILRTALDTSLFGMDEDGNSNGRPVRVLEADNGRVYGVFNSGVYVDDDSNESGRWVNVLSVYQILPYDPTPLTSVQLPEGRNYWDLSARVPFQVNKGFLYHTERESVPFHGEVDVIRMVNLNTGESRTLLADNFDEQRMVVHNWRLSGDTLYFSGQNNATTTSVFGEIDTLAVRDGKDDVLRLREVASARGAALEVRDIEILRPEQPVVDTGGNPRARIFMEPENRASVSVDFTKYMNRDSVLSNLTFRDDAGADIDVMPVWYYQSLHLIPDTSSEGLASRQSRPLKHDTGYTLSISANARDAWDWDLEAVEERFKTLPAEGWLVRPVRGEQQIDGILSGNFAAYLGVYVEGSDWNYQNKRFGLRDTDGYAVEIPSNFSIEFSTRRQSWHAFDLDIVRVTANEDGGELGSRESQLQLFMHQNISIDFRYDTGEGWTNLDWASTADGRNVLSAEWRRYRLTAIDGDLRLYIKSEGGDFEHEPWTRWDNNANDYVEVNNLERLVPFDRDEAVYVAEFRVNNPMSIDNLVITELDSQGNTVGAVFENSFDNASVEQLRTIMGERLLWSETIYYQPIDEDNESDDDEGDDDNGGDDS